MIGRIEAPLARKIIAEAVGTFFFTVAFAIIGNNHPSSAQNTAMSSASTITPVGFVYECGPIYIGFCLMILVFAFGYISMAQFNPAIALAFFLVGAQSLGELLLVTLTNLVFAFAGAVAGTAISGKTHEPFQPLPNRALGFGPGHAVGAEATFTALLIIITLHVAVSCQCGNHFFGLCIGGAVLVGTGAVGGISGGILNPAVATALHLSACRFTPGDTCHKMTELWIYWAPAVVAPVGGSLMFLVLNENPEQLAKQAAALQNGGEVPDGSGRPEFVRAVVNMRSSFLDDDTDSVNDLRRDQRYY